MPSFLRFVAYAVSSRLWPYLCVTLLVSRYCFGHEFGSPPGKALAPLRTTAWVGFVIKETAT
jgi:hypothetical protein